MKNQFRTGLICMIAALLLVPVAALLRSTDSLALAGQLLLGFGMVLEVIGMVLVLFSLAGGKKS